MIVDESDAFGCIVTHDIIHPDYIIVVDEVGGNTSQKSDGYVGGELMFCKTGKMPQQNSNTKIKHYTLLGLTALSGKPIMCCVIFSGKNENILCETGFDMNAEFVGSPDDPGFFENNSRKEKTFTGGPSYHFRWKEVPCFYRWSPNGSITTVILREILATLDELEVFDCSHCQTPCVLLYGHGS